MHSRSPRRLKATSIRELIVGRHPFLPKILDGVAKNFRFNHGLRGYYGLGSAHQGAAVSSAPCLLQSGRVLSAVQVGSSHETPTKRKKDLLLKFFGSFRVFRGQKKRRGSAAPQNTCVIRVIRGGLSEDNNKWPLLLLWGKGINDFFGSGSLDNVRPITGSSFNSSLGNRRSSRLPIFAKFLKSRIAAERIEHWIEAEQRRSEWNICSQRPLVRYREQFL